MSARCQTCGSELATSGRLASPMRPKNSYPFALDVVGLPAVRCSGCGLEHVSARASDLVDAIAERLETELDLARRSAARNGHGQEHRMLDPARIRLELADAAPARTAARALVTPLEPSPERLDELVVSPAVRTALRRFVNGRSPVVKAALGPSFCELVDQHFLNLWGPPGSGKTSLARTLVRELGVPAYRLHLGAATSRYVGETEKRLSAVFDLVRSEGALLFVDEADALFSARVDARSGTDQVLNAIHTHVIQLLDDARGVLVFATNKRSAYDAAVDRRMRHVHVPAPVGDVRIALWKRLLADAPVSPRPDDGWIRKIDRLVEDAAIDPERPFTAWDMKLVLHAATADGAGDAGPPPLVVPRRRIEETLGEHLGDLSAQASRKGAGEGDLRTAMAVIEWAMEEDEAMRHQLRTVLARASEPTARLDLESQARAVRILRAAVRHADGRLRVRREMFDRAGLPGRIDAGALVDVVSKMAGRKSAAAG